MSSEEFPRKEKDLLTSGSGQSFFGAKAYISTPVNGGSKPERPRSTTPTSRIKGKSPRRKPPPRSKSTRSTTPNKRNDSPGKQNTRVEEQQSKERNLSLPVTRNDFNNALPNVEHGDMYHNRKVATKMEGNGVEVYQMRTVKLKGELVVQRRSCQLVKSSEDDTTIKLLRDDDTIVEIFKMSQLQRVVHGAKTPTSKRSLTYKPSSSSHNANGEDDDHFRVCHKWSELNGKVDGNEIVTIIYGNQYLDFHVIDAQVRAKRLASWLIWVTVLASMNTEMPEPDDRAFGGSARGKRRGSMGVEEASLTTATGFLQAAEYSELPGAPIERVSEVSEGLTSRTSPFRADWVGSITCHGTELCRSSNPDMTISAKHNQDAACTMWPVGGQQHIAFFGVFDGHGESGHRCSHFCMRKVVEYISDHVSELEVNTGDVLKAAYQYSDKLLGERHPAWAEFGGTTACSVVMIGKQLTIANCGDSRFVLGRRRNVNSPLEHKDLSIDQNPDNPTEQARIRQAGGFVGSVDEDSEVRVWLDASMNSSGLSMARSLGDHTFKAAGVISEPVITEHTVRSKDEVLIGGSDGVFSVLHSKEVMQTIEDISKSAPGGYRMDASRTAQEILTKSARKWKEEEGDMRDDISVIVIKLPLQLGGGSTAQDISSNHKTSAGDLAVEDEDELKERIRRRIENAKQRRESEQDGSERSSVFTSVSEGSTSSDSSSVSSFKQRKEKEQQLRKSLGEGGKANCSGQHGLRAYNSPNDKLACNRCQSGLVKGSPFYGCKTCKTRICVACYKEGGIV